jgi:hypothetical protein
MGCCRNSGDKFVAVVVGTGEDVDVDIVWFKVGAVTGNWLKNR